jgi:DNA-binding IclR family transcriptional regulator
MKSLLKALETIDAVAEAGSAGIRELSSITGFPPSTIHRIVATLVKKHYLQQDPVTKRYSLSFRFLELSSRVQQQIHLTSIARPHLERLMGETHESINLAVQDGDSAVYLDFVLLTPLMYFLAIINKIAVVINHSNLRSHAKPS